MKILLINNFLDKSGGAETYMHALANILRANGHEILLFGCDKEASQSDDLPKYINYKDLSKPDALKYMFRPFYNVEAEEKLDKLLKKEKPDLVHFHCIYYHLSPSVLNACYINDVPVIMTLHDIRLMCPGGLVMYKYTDYCTAGPCLLGNPLPCLINKCKYGSLSASLFVCMEYIFNKFFGYFDGVSLFLCPSQACYDIALKSGIKRKRLVVLNNFIEYKYPEVRFETSNNEYFLFVGRLSKEKGIHHLIKAMNRIPEAKLFIAGTGPDEVKFKIQAEESGLNNIKFLGFKNGIELENLYKNCTAVVAPSICYETFGLAIVEGFSYGKPVIASKVGAFLELVEDNINGILVEPGNVESLTNAIIKLNSDKQLAVRMGINGRMRAGNIYNSDEHYSKIIKIYESVVKTEMSVLLYQYE